MQEFFSSLLGMFKMHFALEDAFLVLLLILNRMEILNSPRICHHVESVLSKCKTSLNKQTKRLHCYSSPGAYFLNYVITNSLLISLFYQIIAHLFVILSLM